MTYSQLSCNVSTGRQTGENNLWTGRSKRRIWIFLVLIAVVITVIVIPTAVFNGNSEESGPTEVEEGKHDERNEQFHVEEDSVDNEDEIVIPDHTPEEIKDDIEDPKKIVTIKPTKKNPAFGPTTKPPEKKRDPKAKEMIFHKLKEELERRHIKYFEHGTHRTCRIATGTCSCVNSRNEVVYLSSHDLAVICNVVEFLDDEVRVDFEVETFIRMKKHNKKYGTDYCTYAEVQERFYFFRRDAIIIEGHNKNQSKLFVLGYGPNAGSVKDGVKKGDVGYGDLFNGIEFGKFPFTEFDFNGTKLKVPEPTFDWRKRGYVSEVRVQICGSCWAMASASAFDTFVHMKTGEKKKYSVQQILDCASSLSGCNGGSIILGFRYIKNNKMCTEEEYPYKGVKGICEDHKCTGENVARSLEFIHYETAEKQLEENGPFAVAITSDRKLSLYAGGIFDATCIGPDSHAVVIIGHGVDPATNQKYWIAKNSWGTNWGESGYFRIWNHAVRNQYGVMVSYCNLLESARGFS
ncbi:Papain cysteine protease family protein [Theileria equi strain WA]|uniref:Papain cysteine protease family protein n=1 Tax=Theileria equi strain WA TaxID=1537102 RepID=L0AWC5_THEEQ|nr:Papain cysteine protease family protein [Theileria equi strain WA]AFZ79209.1 Papain cysteine protease family protein [Theileria equi strain WA]|eukprot:XP_004828875.1 Papain cysteine protease family protein [Theileria equi strain WA]